MDIELIKLREEHLEIVRNWRDAEGFMGIADSRKVNVCQIVNTGVGLGNWMAELVR